jgi:type II restriction enzyme
MDWIRDQYGRIYAPNTRETIRRHTLHQFVDALLVEQNPDDPNRAVNSPKWCYQVHERALQIIRLYGEQGYGPALSEYLGERPSLKKRYAAARKLTRIPVTLPDGGALALSPGGQNLLLKSMIEDFCAYFTPGGRVLYVGDAGAKWAVFQDDDLRQLGVTVDEHGKMPDLIVYVPDKSWLVLLEAVDSHGPVNSMRRNDLSLIFSSSTAGLVYVSCFSSREEMRTHLADIAWGTDAWCADNPTHLIHFNGEHLLGPTPASNGGSSEYER